jgi:hypothetical protein
MTLAAGTFLDALKTAADQAETAEGEGRREAARRIAVLERERIFAFRRLNLMRAIAGAVSGAETEEIAVASAEATLRARLGWNTDSEVRDAILLRFAAVARAVFQDLAPTQTVPASPVWDALAKFESWYADRHEAPFWALFERYVAETPRVDF